jgi:hypothetical protein
MRSITIGASCTNKLSTAVDNFSVSFPPPLTRPGLRASLKVNEGGEMVNTTCPALVNGKECGLAMILVEQDIDADTEVYECPLGHRKYVMLGEIEKRNCPTLVGSKPCGLALSVVERDPETATEIYECPLGHRTYVPIEPQLIEDEPC